ncbi:MAG: caspase family protein [Deltaproteobacteria bacterium]|nr:caspase family protein [Deltaproteobacteria bacterium]
MTRAALVALLLAAAPARAEKPAPAEANVAQFALIIGVNHAAEPNLPTLQYADDDAASYEDLFRLLGARTYLLSRLDENTQRLHPQAAAEAREPTRKQLDEVVKQLASDVAQAKARQLSTVLYFVYAGHGNVEGDVGYLSLEDARLTGHTLAHDVLEAIDADRAHLIVDACYSFFLAYGRGPGGSRRPLRNFTQTPELASNDKWGLLLSTSSARESHEWEGFQAGVFSHEVRSGLYGAADADGDGWVSYPEMVAFIQRANGAIANDKFRPDVFARPPKGSDLLADLRQAESRHIEIQGKEHAHYLLEDGRGVRLADFHNGPSQTTRLLHPVGAGPLYLRRLDTDQEFSIPPAEDVVTVASLEPSTPRVATRGAAHDAFSLLFSLEFSRADVGPMPTLLELDRRNEEPSIFADRHTWGWLSVGAGIVGGGAAVVAVSQAESARRSVAPHASQADAANANARIRSDNRLAWILGGVGVAAETAGVALLLWPDGDGDHSLSLVGTPTSASVAWATSF